MGYDSSEHDTHKEKICNIYSGSRYLGTGATVKIEKKNKLLREPHRSPTAD
jgi:hypothetical protein